MAKVDRSYVRSAWTDLGSQAESSAKQHQLPLTPPDHFGFSAVVTNTSTSVRTAIEPSR